jgi:prepilin-type N-terminal cleavage/methylation domain-containing protein
MLRSPSAASRRRQLAPRHKANEAGYTLVEMMTVVAIMGVILAALLSSLISATNSQTNTEALVANQETVRLALDRMQQDLTEANPVDTLATTSTYANEVQVEVTPSSGTTQVIRWYYDPNAGVIYRDIMSGNTTSATIVSQQSVITNVTNASSGTQLFTYYDANDNNLQTANPSTPANVANCVIRIHVDVAAASDPGPLPFHETLDVELRNRLPGGVVGCPNG